MELLIVLFILGILGSIGYQWLKGDQQVSWGVNGRVETRCINGFVHSVGQRGYTQQTIDENGRGIKCDAK